jgi:hypothetical protein
MKGTVQRPPWPAPAAKTATRSETAHGPRTTASDLDELTSESPTDPSNQIGLAILEESSMARANGYDPYNKVAWHRPGGGHRQRKRD